MENSVIRGDCLEVMPKIGDGSVDMIFTDLPYEVTARNTWDKLISFDKLWLQYERIIKPNGAIVLTATQPFASQLVLSNQKLFKYEWIWRKQQGTGFLNAKKQPLRNHEQVLVFYKAQPTYNPQFTEGKPYTCKSGRATSNYNDQHSVVTENEGKRYPLTVLEFPYDKKKLHPTQKPLALCEYMVKTYTNEGELVLDTCCGSGSIPLAAKNLNRRYIGIELSEEYAEISQKRLSGVL
jgi:site-specific DNA-methyltransferase (adenine-specific)